MSNRRRRNNGNVIKGAFGRSRVSGPRRGTAGHPAIDPALEELAMAGEEAGRRIDHALRMCWGDGRLAKEWAGQFFAGFARPDLIDGELRKQVNRAIDEVRGRGWLPGDLVQVMRRKAKAEVLPVLCAALHQHSERFGSGRDPAGWLEGVGQLPGDAQSFWKASLPDLLAITAVLRNLPAIARVDLAVPVTEASGNRHLAKVRALLAKAESTTFEAEAEALIAKAQELINRHSLTEALADTGAYAAAGVVARRVWLDGPYLDPKSTLVHAVARANRCRSVFTPAFGFVTLIGAAADLDAVELLVTSLLTQAESVMRVYRGSTAEPGPVRTKSFRRAFLLSYATRIEQRLREAGETVMTQTEGADRLLPVLADRAAQVEARTAELFPQATAGRRATVTNMHGWYADKAAADLARLGERGEIGT